jgi:SAM-dependent methyltransferase
MIPAMSETAPDRWHGGREYESFIGRWSRLVAGEFIDWLDVPAGRSWLDVGSGTGALAATIMARAEPASVVGIDRSADFVAVAGEGLDDPRVVFLVGDAAALPFAAGHMDAVVSALVLNFLPDPEAAVAEWRRVARPGAIVAAYVWDYADGMQPLRAFWDAAGELSAAARHLDEAVRFPLCDPVRLRTLFVRSGLTAVETRSIDIEARFLDFDDYWTPFLSGVGPAPGYCAALAEDQRDALRELLRTRLSPAGAGPIVMHARAFAVRGAAPAARS